MKAQDEAVAPPSRQQAIAVIGLACRFPDAHNPAALLDLVVHGRRAFRRIPPERLDLADYYNDGRDAADTASSVRAALIEGWRFDRVASGVSKSDYVGTDPAHWLALETTARALAGAGFPAGTSLPGDRVGVFFGTGPALDAAPAAGLRPRWPYGRRAVTTALARGQVPAEAADRVVADTGARHLAPLHPVATKALTGSAPAGPVTAIRRQLGLSGGGCTVDAAVASSLAATVAACVALASGEVDVAVTGGVDLGIGPPGPAGLAKAGLLATGECRVYDEFPTGLLPGEGCGSALLMRAADARAAGLPVRAEIAGWGMASGGRMPEPDAGTHLLAMQRAHEMAGIDPADVQLIEGAGTGDQAGDEAELSALADLREGARLVAALGTINANIGYAGAAAGSAGLIKAVLAIANGVLPPSTGVRTPHPVLRDGRPALRLPAVAEAWPRGTRHAGVSGAGPDGLAVHLLLHAEPGEPVPPHNIPSRSLPRAVQAGPVQGGSLRPGRPRRPALAAENLTEPALRLPADWSSGQYSSGTGHPFAYLLQAPDQQTMSAVLSRIRDIGPWLSDGELQDLAVLLARNHGAAGLPAAGLPAARRPHDAARAPGGQHSTRIALVASGQDELAARAGEAMTLLPELTTSALRTRPGIFAAGPGADPAGRVALIICGERDDLADLPQRQLSRILAVLHWLEEAGTEAAAATGNGIGEIAGLVWAGCTSPGDARRLTALRSSALAAAPWQAPGQLSSTIGKYGMLAFRTAQRRLISGTTGRQVGEPGGIAEILCAELFEARLAADHATTIGAGPAPAAKPTPGDQDARGASARPLAAAIAAIARNASLVVRTGQDERLSEAFGLLGDVLMLTDIGQPAQGGRPVTASRTGEPDRASGPAWPGDTGQHDRVPLVGIDGDPAEDGNLAQAAAALFAVGALTRPAALYAERPSRPFELWRDAVYITAPSQAPAAAIPAPATADTGRAGAAESGTAATQAPTARIARPRTNRPSRPRMAAAAQADSAGRAEPRTDRPAGPRMEAAAEAGSLPWFCCYAQQTQRPSFPVPAGDDRPWRLYTGGCAEFGPGTGELFRHDPDAGRTLAVLGTLDRAGARSALLRAAQDAVGTGSLVAISPGPGPAGPLATLHAEHPALGITVLRAPLTPAGLQAARRFAATAPAQYRELVIGQDGTPTEPVLSPLAGPYDGDFPFGPQDVALISRSSGAAGLAIAQVLACSGTAVAIVGRGGPDPDDQVVAGLEELRGAGAKVGYELVSLSDHAALVAAVRRIEARFGRVTALSHAAGMLSRGQLTGIGQAQAERNVVAAVTPLEQIAAAVRAAARSGTSPGQVRLVITSASIAGRCGMAGESMTALAAAALADYGERAAAALADYGERAAAASPGCRALHVDWPGWAGDGLGQRADLGAVLAAAGIATIPVAEASRQLLKALRRDGLPGRIAVHGRAGVPAPRPVTVAASWAQGGRRLVASS